MERVVLVVGPDGVRRFAATAIAGGDYRTLEVESAEEALSVLENQVNVSLVVSSVSHVDAADGQLASAIKQRWPHIAVVIAAHNAHEADELRSCDRPAGHTLH